MRALIAGNWKMNGAGQAALDEIDLVAQGIPKFGTPEVLICPPATLIGRAVTVARGRLAIGGQDCHADVWGAYTGDISAEMLKDAGATAVIVGHSERRHYHGETNEGVAAKASAAWRAGLTAIICIGETEQERRDRATLRVCEQQILGSVPQDARAETTAIAYEPVWAIGTGRTPTSEEIVEVHNHIRALLQKRLGATGAAVRILYGGSVKPSNAAEILALPNVGGALVGGASLKAADFLPIVSAAG